MADLLLSAGEISEAVPTIRPLFLNVGRLSAERIDTFGGGAGPVLRLLPKRKARPPEFRSLLAHTLERVNGLVEAEPTRWADLMTYIHALVYNERPQRERRTLQKLILDSMPSELHRQESIQMAETMADVLRREGKREGKLEGECHARQQTLLRQLTQRFGDVPHEVVKAVEATQDVERLDAWLDRILTATTLDEMQLASTT
jgi:hypothetical protein